jgi:2-oxoisovalerate dehydrogenase E1 component alpha subunit
VSSRTHQEEVPLRGTNWATTGPPNQAVRSVPVGSSTDSELSGNSELSANPEGSGNSGRSDADEQRLLRHVYDLAVRTRRLDERLWILYRQGLAGFVLTARGHEVAQIASALALQPGLDYAWPYYRDMGVALALGVSPREILLGALGRAEDPHTGGRQLPMHLSDPERRIGSVSSAIAGHIPHAVGAAYAARVRGDDWVSVCWFGDGATSEGVTHEAMNLAAIHNLPVVFICENNDWAISVPLALQVAGRDIAGRASAYGMPGSRVDGADALAVFDATSAALECARSGGGPVLLEVQVSRMTPHSSQDDDAYRTPAEKQAAMDADPLPHLRQRLFELGALGKTEDEHLWQAAEREMSVAAKEAEASPAPPPGRAHQHLYSESGGQ